MLIPEPEKKMFSEHPNLLARDTYFGAKIAKNIIIRRKLSLKYSKNVKILMGV